MKVIQVIRCYFGSHPPYRRKAIQRGGDYHSVCNGCGEPMVRGLNGTVLTQNDPYSQRDE